MFKLLKIKISFNFFDTNSIINFNFLDFWYKYVTGVAKGVFYTHLIYELWQVITWNWKKVLSCNLVSSECQWWRKFQNCIVLEHKVLIFQVHRTGCLWKTLFANPVTYVSLTFSYTGPSVVGVDVHILYTTINYVKIILFWNHFLLLKIMDG